MSGGVMFAELHMLSGERQKSSHLVGIATPPILSIFKRRRGQLFTVVEPNLPEAGALCQRLITTIEDEYFRDASRSITSSLRSAMAVAGELLRAENSKAPLDTQLRVGLSCAAVRDEDVYIAQVAPANAFILHDGIVNRVFCTYSVIPDIGGKEDGTADSLGSPSEPRVNLAYSLLQEGDLVALCSGPYWKLLSDRYFLDAAKHVDPDMAASELYNGYIAHARRPTTSLVVIKVAGASARQQRNGHPHIDENRPTLVEMSELSTVPTRTRPPNGTSKTRVDGDGVRTRSPSWRDDMGYSPRRQETRSSPRRDEIAPSPRREETRPQTRRDESGSRARPSPLAWLLSRLSGSREPLYPEGPPLEAVGSGRSVKLKNDQWPQRWSARDERPEWIGKLAAMIALAAVFVLLGNLLAGAWKSWQLGDPVALVKDAQAKRSLASAAENPTAARASLAQAYELLARAQRAKDEDATRTLASNVLSDLDRIDKTVRIGQAKLLVDYSSIVNDKGDVTHLVQDSGNLYVLDEGLDRVYRYDLTQDGSDVLDRGKHILVMKRGDKVEGTPVGKLSAIAWMPAGQLRTNPALFTLEGGKSIVAYDPTAGLSRVDVAESQRWGVIQSFNGFAGGLYLLDSKQKGIYYYPPTKNGYQSEPYTIVDSRAKADLSKAMDVALDGNLYALESTGAIRRFNRDGKPLDFPGELLDGPMKGARSLYASANTRSLYVVDAADERILQFSPEGQLQRQFKAQGKDISFKDLRDLTVDEAGRKMYLLTRKSLILIDLPPMQ